MEKIIHFNDSDDLLRYLYQAVKNPDYNYDKIEEWLEEHKKDRIRNAIQKDKYDLSMIVDLLPCNKCKWRYSICCPKCNWNRNGKYKVY